MAVATIIVTAAAVAAVPLLLLLSNNTNNNKNTSFLVCFLMENHKETAYELEHHRFIGVFVFTQVYLVFVFTLVFV